MKLIKLFRENLSFLFILLIASFLGIDRIQELMTFIGDQAWFYTSARDMILNGEVPLVGIPSSRPWLHQGPLWTYVLAFALWLGNFHPASGAYLTALIGVLSIVLIYAICSEFFDKRFAFLVSLIYATSPLVIFYMRMPYHTSPIPFFVIFLFYALLKWIRGKPQYFPLVIFSMSMLYNFHLGTVVFWPVIIFFLFYGLSKKAEFFQALMSAKVFIASFLALILPMTPILIYDFTHGFPQTLRYGAWFGYKLLQLLGIIERNASDTNSYLDTFKFFFSKYETLTIMTGLVISILIFFLSLLISLNEFKKNKITAPFNIIFLLTSIGIISFFVSNVLSEAYLLMLFPGLIFMFAFSFYKMLGKISVYFAITIAFFNTYTLTTTNYLMRDRLTLEKRIEASEKILELAGGTDYNLIYKGPGEEFESSIMSYTYLTWWLGNKPSDEQENLVIIVKEGNDVITLYKEVKVKQKSS